MINNLQLVTNFSLGSSLAHSQYLIIFNSCEILTNNYFLNLIDVTNFSLASPNSRTSKAAESAEMNSNPFQPTTSNAISTQDIDLPSLSSNTSQGTVVENTESDDRTSNVSILQPTESAQVYSNPLQPTTSNAIGRQAISFPSSLISNTYVGTSKGAILEHAQSSNVHSNPSPTTSKPSLISSTTGIIQLSSFHSYLYAYCQ